MLNNPDYSILIGDAVDQGNIDENVAFPFLYNFVSRNDDTWDVDKVESGEENLIGIGPQIPPNSRRIHNIKLDPDYAFNILWFKYTVYHIPELALAGYRWYEPVGGWGLDDFHDYQSYIGTPLTHWIRVKVSVASGGQILCGNRADQLSYSNNYGDIVPLAADVSQGYDYGYGQLAIPYLAPKDGLIQFEIWNTHTVKTLVVGGCVYGFKIRL